MRIHDALIISEKGEQSLKMIFCYLESFLSIFDIINSCEVCLWYFVVVNHATIVGNLKEISTYVLRSTHCREFLKLKMNCAGLTRETRSSCGTLTRRTSRRSGRTTAWRIRYGVPVDRVGPDTGLKGTGNITGVYIM